MTFMLWLGTDDLCQAFERTDNVTLEKRCDAGRQRFIRGAGALTVKLAHSALGALCGVQHAHVKGRPRILFSLKIVEDIFILA